MPELLTIEQAKKHLRLSASTHEDDDVQLKLAQAQQMVLDYLGDETDTDWTAEIAAWDDETVPAPVSAAILLQLGFLYRYRGDQPDDTKAEYGELAPGVKACLYRLRPLVIG